MGARSQHDLPTQRIARRVGLVLAAAVPTAESVVGVGVIWSEVQRMEEPVGEAHGAGLSDGVLSDVQLVEWRVAGEDGDEEGDPLVAQPAVAQRERPQPRDAHAQLAGEDSSPVRAKGRVGEVETHEISCEGEAERRLQVARRALGA